MYFTQAIGSDPVGLQLGIDPGLSDETADRMTLRIGGDSFPLSSAARRTSPGASFVNYYWDESSSPLAGGSTYSVSLSLVGGAGGRRAERTPVPTYAPPAPTCDELPKSVTVSGARVGEQCRLVDAAGVGNADFAALFLGAVDVWSYLGAGVTVCFEGAGAIGFLDAATSPRTAYALDSETRENRTCAFIDRPGTVVLLPADAAALKSLPALSMLSPGAPARRRGLAGCLVTPTHILNLRAGPDGAIIGAVWRGSRLAATARESGWYEVAGLGVTGWISADYVRTEGDCG